MDPKEHLMTVLQSLIHDKQDEASEAIRQAIVVKSQQIIGRRDAAPVDVPEQK